jgi:hypothetical protein
VKICTNDHAITCRTADDCVVGGNAGQCLPGGHCASSENLVCIPEFGVCGDGSDCMANRVCSERRSCDSGDYATPAVEMAPRAQAALDIPASFAAQEVEGGTPTGPALAGALDYARSWISDHPEHSAAVVLVTDGLPTECTPLDITDIAAVAAADATTIPTYVIGVFEDELAAKAQTNLDALAKAGGTANAFLVTLSSSVSADVSAALGEIRASQIRCELEIPDSTEGAVRYDHVNVDVTRGGSPTERFHYVSQSADCAGSDDVWHYDVPPADGTPSRIHLCPAACESLQGDADASISVVLGCPTILR